MDNMFDTYTSKLQDINNFITDVLPTTSFMYLNELDDQLNEFASKEKQLNVTNKDLNAVKDGIKAITQGDNDTNISPVKIEIKEQLENISTLMSNMIDVLRQALKARQIQDQSSSSQAIKKNKLNTNDELRQVEEQVAKDNEKCLTDFNALKPEIRLGLEICGITIQNFKKLIKIVPLTSDTYEIRKVYVLMFVNTQFQILPSLEGLKSDIVKAREIFDNDVRFVFDEPQLNKSEDETLTTLKTLGEGQGKQQELKDCEALLVTFSTHGADNGLVYASSGTFNVTDVWSKCDENRNLLNKPIIAIFSCCRGGNDEVIKMSTQTFQELNPELYYPTRLNLLSVFASAHGRSSYMDPALPNTYTPSYFLHYLFESFRINKNCDILAQITLTTKQVIDNICLQAENQTEQQFSQTVNYLSVLPGQFILTTGLGDQDDGWRDMEKYATGPALVFIVDFDEQKNKGLKGAFENIGMETNAEQKLTSAVDKAVTLINDPTKNYKSLIFVIHMLMSNKNEPFRKKLQVYMEYTFSVLKCPKLKGCPKIAFLIGNKTSENMINELEKISIPENKSYIHGDARRKEVTINPNETRVTETSDTLIYSDSSEGWFESMLEVIQKLPVCKSGLVRLLTSTSMKRLSAQCTLNPPNIHSSLRKNFVWHK